MGAELSLCLLATKNNPAQARLMGLPILKPTNIVSGRENKIRKMPPSKDRSKLRSKTYSGIAEAMANQWGTA